MAQQSHPTPRQQAEADLDRGRSKLPADVDRTERIDVEPADELSTSFIGATAVFGLIVGGVVGGALGLLFALIPGVSWWAGLMVGAIGGLTLAAIALPRLGMNKLDVESRPPAVTTTRGRR